MTKPRKQLLLAGILSVATVLYLAAFLGQRKIGLCSKGGVIQTQVGETQMSEDRKWIKLKRKGVWGSESIVKKGEDPYKARGFEFSKGKSLEIRWPDGTFSKVTIVNHSYDGSYSDMGREIAGSYELPGFMAIHHGVKVWIPLDEVEIDEKDLPKREERGPKPDAK